VASLRKIFWDETGGEALEYVLVVALIVTAAIATLSSVTTKIVAYWSSDLVP